LIEIAQVATPDEIREVSAMLREYTTWAFTLESRSDSAPTFEGLERELATLPGVYAPPKGRLLIATVDGVLAGCIALKPVDDTTGELKRLYVRPEFRGQKIGPQLVAAFIAEARVAGYRRVVLDSHFSMAAAHTVYLAAGFRKVEAPPGFPKELVPVVVFMEMTLD
jgi:GNAT superfamily N-acetyltransferase